MRRPPSSTLFPYPTLFRSDDAIHFLAGVLQALRQLIQARHDEARRAAQPLSLWRYCTARHMHLRAAEVERSEEHTSELQSPCNLVCRLLLEKKKNRTATELYSANFIRRCACTGMVPRPDDQNMVRPCFGGCECQMIAIACKRDSFVSMVLSS